jgi:hypothetical protein
MNVIETYAEKLAPENTDIAVYGPDGRLQLIVEINSQLGTDLEWAARYRRNLIVNAVVPITPFFLVAAPDRFYLWRQEPFLSNIVPPDFEIDPGSVLAPYIDEAVRLSGRLGNSSLQLAVSAWLSDIVLPHTDDAPDNPVPQQFIDAGLFHAITCGTVASS